MTEEIIIDGVNVARCHYYEEGDCCNKDILTLSCENTNCMYKQLKRLEQENKALKDNNNYLQAIIDDGRAENKRFREENKELKEEKSKLLDKNFEKQCRINELLNICSTKEFILKVNGKKYSGLNGIDKAKLFINNENAVRDKYIKKLEAEISNIQWQFVDAHKKIYKYRSALEEIRDIVNNYSKCFYGDCEDCLYYQECQKANIECDCSKWHIDKINEVLNDN